MLPRVARCDADTQEAVGTCFRLSRHLLFFQDQMPFELLKVVLKHKAVLGVCDTSVLRELNSELT